MRKKCIERASGCLPAFPGLTSVESDRLAPGLESRGLLAAVSPVLAPRPPLRCGGCGELRVRQMPALRPVSFSHEEEHWAEGQKARPKLFINSLLASDHCRLSYLGLYFLIFKMRGLDYLGGLPAPMRHSLILF